MTAINFTPGTRVQHNVKPSWHGTVVRHIAGDAYIVEWDYRPGNPYEGRNLRPLDDGS